MKHKLITAVITALFLISVSSAFADDTPNINGVWILDKAKSQGLPPGLDQQIMTITKTGDEISIETKTGTGKDEKIKSKSYKLDGKEADYSESVKVTKTKNSPEGDGNTETSKTIKGKEVAKWTADGIEISRTSIYDAPEGNVTIKTSRKFTLSSDGKTLVLNITVQSPTVKSETKLAFSKK